MDATYDELARANGLPPRPRKRGGQPGNKNVLTHGFYSKTYRNIQNPNLRQRARELRAEPTPSNRPV